MTPRRRVSREDESEEAYRSEREGATKGPPCGAEKDRQAVGTGLPLAERDDPASLFQAGLLIATEASGSPYVVATTVEAGRFITRGNAARPWEFPALRGWSPRELGTVLEPPLSEWAKVHWSTGEV